ncbi:MAG TPA: hypothetical protein VF585_06295 [Chthoniobacterales bacterium]|jgi:hypothetical protein
MLSPKIAGLTMLALLLGIGAGRLSLPNSDTKGKHSKAGTNTRTANTRESDRSNDPGTYRAVSDILPGNEKREQKRIPTLLELLQMTNHRQVEKGAGRFAQSLDREGVMTTLERIETVPKIGMLYFVKAHLIMRLAELDPREAVRYLDAVSGAFAALAGKDPVGALKFITSVSTKERFEAGLYSTLAGFAPEAAAKAALELPSGLGRLSAVESVVWVWGMADPHGALRWIETLPATGMRQQAVGTALQMWAHANPEAAAEYVSKLPPGSTFQQGVIRITQMWMQKNPSDALTWIESLPAGLARQDALRTGLGNGRRILPRRPQTTSLSFPTTSSLADTCKRSAHIGAPAILRVPLHGRKPRRTKRSRAASP